MAKIIRLSAPGASGATGGGSTPASLQLALAGSSGHVGEPYSAALVAVGGVPPYTFAIHAGALPTGLSLNTATGAITGTPTTAGSYSFTGRVTDSATTVVDLACAIVVPNEAPGDFIGLVTAASAAEVANSVYHDTLDGLHMVIGVSATLSAAAFPVPCRVWFDYDDGAGFIIQGDKYAGSSSASWTFGEQQQQTGLTIPGTIWVPTDPAKINWRVAVEANSRDAQPSGSAIINTFTVTAAQPTPNTDLTNIHFVPNPTTGDPIIYALADPGIWFYIWYLLEYTQPATSAAIAGGDPYFKSSFCTKQLGYASVGTCTVTSSVNVQLTAGSALSTDVGNLIHVGGALARITAFTDSTHVTIGATLNGSAVMNTAGQFSEIWRPAPVALFGDEGADDEDAIAQGYWGRKFTDGPPPSQLGASVAQFSGTPSWNIPPTTNPDGSANPYVEMRIWVWAVSRLADNEAGGTGAITLNVGWPGAADHGSLFPTQQSAALDLTRTKASTLGRGVGKELGTGRVQVNISPTSPLAVDGGNNIYVALANDFVVQTVGGIPTLTQQIVNLALATNFGTEFTKSGGLLIINAIAVNKLIAGDALFAGQATFATTGGGKVIINSSGVTIQNKITSPTVSVTLSSTALTITGPNGTLTADSTSIRITNGSSSVEVTSTAVAIINGSFAVTNGTTTINIDATNRIKISDSLNTFSVKLSTGLSGPASSVLDGYLHAWGGGLLGIGTFTSGGSLATISGPALVAFSTTNAYSIVDTAGLFVRGPSANSAYVAYNSIGFNSTQVIGARQTGPGNSTDVTDVATRFNSLLGALRTHGLIT